MTFRCVWVTVFLPDRWNHKDFGSLAVYLFLYSLLLSLVFVFYTHDFNYSFRVMNQSQTNKLRSEVISWTSFLTHSSSKRQVHYLLLLVLQCCSNGCASITEMQQTPPSPAGRQGAGTFSSACSCSRIPSPAFTAPLLCHLHEENLKGMRVSVRAQYKRSVQTWRKAHRFNHITRGSAG